jgi:hypothetical protein
MPRCLFCLTEADKLTDEHVFPAALGGNLVVKNATCAACNNGLSKQFEQFIAKRLTHFRRVLSIKDRRGDLPKIEVKVEVSGEEREAWLMPDGTTVLKPHVTEVSKDGVTEKVFQNLSEQQKESLRQAAREKGWELIEEQSPGGEVDASFSGDLDFLTSGEMLRNAAKIAYSALAFRMGVSFAQSDSFNEMRTYVRAGEGTPRARLFLNETFLGASEQGPHQHSVVIVGRRDKKRVDAIVRFFGGLCYSVTLSDDYAGADFFDTLAYDAQRGEIDKILVTHEQTEFLQIEHVTEGKETIWDDQRRSGEWFLKFFDRAIQRATGSSKSDETPNDKG